jgi:hypothetical protein
MRTESSVVNVLLICPLQIATEVIPIMCPCLAFLGRVLGAPKKPLECTGERRPDVGVRWVLGIDHEIHSASEGLWRDTVPELLGDASDLGVDQREEPSEQPGEEGDDLALIEIGYFSSYVHWNT